MGQLGFRRLRKASLKSHASQPRRHNRRSTWRRTVAFEILEPRQVLAASPFSCLWADRGAIEPNAPDNEPVELAVRPAEVQFAQEMSYRDGETESRNKADRAQPAKSVSPDQYGITITAAGDAEGESGGFLPAAGFARGRLNVNVNGVVGRTGVASYATGQDVTPRRYTVEDNGATLRLKGNTWKRVQANYIVTASTVLEFDFRTDDLGEVHAIGVDNDNTLSVTDTFFQLAGTQPWWAHQDFNDYQVNSGWRHYVIPLGEFFTGNIAQIVMVADDDATLFTESVFRNLRIYESDVSVEVNGVTTDFTINSYAVGEDNTPTRFGVEDGGKTVHLRGNSWKRMDLSYQVTPGTMVEFDFRTDDLGEIHAIGFDRNNTLNSSDTFFQLAGTQSWWAHQDYNNYQVSSGWKHYVIPLGEYLTGSISQVVLAADDDAKGSAESLFRNLRFFESQLSIDLNGVPAVAAIASYSVGQDLTGTLYGVEDNRQTLHLRGNSWKQLELLYRIGQGTMLEFDFRAGDDGEVHAIGLDDNNRYSRGDHFFQLGGTQPWWGYQEFNDYESSDGWRHYVIPVGSYFTGVISQIVLVADDDLTARSDSQFANIRLYESNHTPVITSPPRITAQAGTPYSYQVVAADPDANDTLTYALVVAPSGMIIDSATGVVTWAPSLTQTGANAVTVLVWDSALATATQSFTVTVGDTGAAIPELALWESQMLQWGVYHATRLLDGTYGVDDTYYDAQRVFQQIAEYTGDASWLTVADRAQQIYVENYLITSGANVPGYWSFTHGLANDYLATGDVQAREWAIQLSQNASYAPDGTPLAWTAPADRSREVAYNMMAYINAERLGEPHRARLDALFEQALDHCTQWFSQGYEGAEGMKPFMFGLTAEALIYYWTYVKQDPRIITQLELGAQWIWNHAWLPSKESFYYTSFNPTVGAPDLNLLIAPVYSWLYLHTGNTLYRDQGDNVFAGGVRHSFLAGSKQFNQDYRWSFDYIKWRRLAE